MLTSVLPYLFETVVSSTFQSLTLQSRTETGSRSSEAERPAEPSLAEGSPGSRSKKSPGRESRGLPFFWGNFTFSRIRVGSCRAPRFLVFKSSIRKIGPQPPRALSFQGTLSSGGAIRPGSPPYHEAPRVEPARARPRPRKENIIQQMKQ